MLPAGSRYDESDMYARYTMRDAGNRELTFDYRFQPGTYVMMPSIEDSRRRRKYYLRIYTENEAATASVTFTMLEYIHVYLLEFRLQQFVQ